MADAITPGRVDLGAVSAYAVAVEHGFDGTEAEWEEYIANASNNAAAANTSKLAAEGYAVGKQNGQDVPSTSPYYENNAKYYMEQAKESVPADYTELIGDVEDLKSALTDKADTSVIAEECDSTATYAVGDYCIHEGVLYKCNTAIATAEAWTAAHWTATAVMMETGGGGGVSDVQVNGTSIVQGGVANVPMASASVAGVVRPDGDYGTQIVDKRISVVKAADNQTQEGTHQRRPIVPYNQHLSTFYGLAKAAGDSTQSASANSVGNYTADAIDKILAMLGVADLIGNAEGATASKAYSVNDVLLYKGKLHKVTANIASGGAIVPGTNVTQTTIIEMIGGN